MKNLFKLAIVTVILVSLMGCAAHVHKIGNGPQTGMIEQERQWYVLWGLVPINNVETEVMAVGAVDYSIKTEASALDVIINIFTGMVTVYSRTVTVEK